MQLAYGAAAVGTRIVDPAADLRVVVVLRAESPPILPGNNPIDSENDGEFNLRRLEDQGKANKILALGSWLMAPG
jgi:hypothetical protein